MCHSQCTLEPSSCQRTVSVVADLDENAINQAELWVKGVLNQRIFLKDEYHMSLVSIVTKLAAAGGAGLFARLSAQSQSAERRAGLERYWQDFEGLLESSLDQPEQTSLANDGWKGANDRVNVAVIGIHGMGQRHVTAFHELENVRVAALCDVDESLFEERVQKLYHDPGLPEPKIYTDLRRLYEDKDVDAVSLVTPNHWHTLGAIWAAQAGKHVTVEKPCCHTFHEGQKLVEAAARYDVIVQDGAEQRSNPCAQSMKRFLNGGGLGEVSLARLHGPGGGAEQVALKRLLVHLSRQKNKNVHYDREQHAAPRACRC